MSNEVVWLPDERVYAELTSMHAHYACVTYTKEGIEYNIIVEHDEYDIIEGEARDNSNQPGMHRMS